MGDQKITVVADTGPLLHLAEIGCTHLLNSYENIICPECVQHEYSKHKSSHFPHMRDLPNINIMKVPPDELTSFIELHQLDSIHWGEKECLFLCLQRRISILFSDDLAVREAAKRLHVTPVGSLGILIKAYEMKILSMPEAEKRILSLYENSSLFVTRTIIDLVIETLHEM